jgi:hypothetical protein
VFRETRRAAQEAVQAGTLSATNPMLHDFNRRILKCPEHKCVCMQWREQRPWLRC